MLFLQCYQNGPHGGRFYIFSNLMFDDLLSSYRSIEMNLRYHGPFKGPNLTRGNICIFKKVLPIRKKNASVTLFVNSKVTLSDFKLSYCASHLNPIPSIENHCNIQSQKSIINSLDTLDLSVNNRSETNKTSTKIFEMN